MSDEYSCSEIISISTLPGTPHGIDLPQEGGKEVPAALVQDSGQGRPGPAGAGSEEGTGQYPATVPSNVSPRRVLYMLNYRIPGMGTPFPKCLNPEYSIRHVHCEADHDHDHVQVQNETCGRIECPNCYPTWVHRAADRIGCRVDAYATFERFRPRHVVISLPWSHQFYKETWLDGKTDQELLQAMRKEFTAIAKLAGVTAAAMVIHPWRVDKQLIGEELDDTKAWEYVRKHPERWVELVYWSPHAHLASYGFLRPTKKGSPYFVKNIGALRDRDNLEAMIRYALSHTPHVQGKMTYTYIGKVGTSVFHPVGLHKEKEPLKCRICGASMRYDDTGAPVWLYRSVASSWTRTVKDYFLNLDQKGPPLLVKKGPEAL